MFWDDLVRRWRRESKVVSPRLLRGAAGNVAVLPEPRPQRRTNLLLVLVVLLALGALMLAGSGRVQAPTGTTEPTPASSAVLAA
jgi:hypothetical protein